MKSSPYLLTLLLTFLIGTSASSHRARAAERDWGKFVAERCQDSPPKPGQIICIGSSHMQYWKTVNEDLAPLTIYNFGIGGTTMKDAAEQFARHLAIPFKPRAVILYEGSNDIARGATPAEILAQFRDFQGQIHRVLPRTRIYVLGVVPSPGERFERWETMQQSNAALKQECEANELLTYIDTTSGLIGEDGTPKLSCFIPGDIHMNAEGYKVWAAAVAPVVTEKEKQNQQPVARPTKP